MKYENRILDKDTLNYIHDEITKLEIDHWNKYRNCNEYARAKDMAYREVVRILTNVLNK